MGLRRLDWLLAIAVGAVTGGVMVNGPICYPFYRALGARMIGYSPYQPVACDFHVTIAMGWGVAVAIIAVLIFAIRMRRRSNPPSSRA